jgi:hypothetical protein
VAAVPFSGLASTAWVLDDSVCWRIIGYRDLART